MADTFDWSDYLPVNNSSFWPSSVRFAKTLTPDEVQWLSDHPEVEFTDDPERNVDILRGYMEDEALDGGFVGCVRPGILAMRGTEGCWHDEERTAECGCSCHKRVGISVVRG